MKPGPSTARSITELVAVAALYPITWLFGHLPVGAGTWMGSRLGDLAWLLVPRRRAIALANLARALGGLHPAPERHRLARRSFQHLGMTFVETCGLFFRPPASILARVEMNGGERLREAAAQGKGVLVLTAHYGNWELLGAAHILSGLPLSVVARPLDQPLLERLAARLRRRAGIELIDKRHGLRDVLQALRQGRMVGILLDQNAARSEGVFVPFFGVPASTSKGLALIALRTRAPVVPVFIRRLGAGRHRVEVGAALPPPADDDVVAYTAAFNRAIEAAIRQAPEQWFWMHNRWRTRPRRKRTS
jgi:KDO2-lipid IV(A) lauroyltransferase